MSHLAKRVKVEETEAQSVPSAISYSWLNCENKAGDERIIIKEHATDRAAFHITELCDLLRKYSKDDESPGASTLQDWINDADETIEDHQKFEVLVGVAGQTGAGKTSLLNGLLDVYELLPSGHEQAATAVSCKVSWNYDMTSGKENIAEIIFQSETDVLSQIVETLKAFKSYHDIDRAHYDKEDERLTDLAEAAADIKDGMDKIYAIWRVSNEEIKAIAMACNKTSEFREAAERLLHRNETVTELLNTKTKSFASPIAEDLAKVIKPYLDSTSDTHGHTKGEFAAWPLIKNVHIKTRSPILRNGISLVDLPGIGDNVESRARVAEEYRSSLEVTMIVTAIHRAADEKSTQKLLTDSQEMRSRMAQGYNSRAFGVVLSKMDDLDWGGYIKRSREAQNDPLVQEHSSIVTQADKETKSLMNQKKEINKMIKKARTGLKKFGDKKETTDSRLRKASIQAEMNLGQERLEQLNQMITAEQKTVKVSKLHLQHWATSKRSAVVQARLCEDHQRRQAQLRAEDSPSEEPPQLDVMASSAREFWKLRGRKKGLTAFPAEEYTGIPMVIQWISLATTPARERHLDMILQQYRHLLERMHQWCKTENISLDLKVDVASVTNALEEEYAGLGKELTSLFGEFYSEVTKLDPFGKPNKPKANFKAHAKKIAARWAMKYPDDGASSTRMPWNTYSGIAKRSGGPYTSSGGGIEYDWIPKLAQPLVSSLANKWTTELNARLPSIWKDQAAKLRNVIEEHFKRVSLIVEEHESALSPYLRETKDTVIGVRELINSKVRVAIGKFQKSTDTLSAAIDSIRASMEKPFAQCKDITGKGSYIKRRELLESAVDQDANSYFKSAWDSMKTDLKKSTEAMKAELDAIEASALRDARSPVEMTIANVMGDASSPNSISAKRRVEAILQTWEDEWKFPGSNSQHFLSKDMSIPSKLLPQHLIGMDENEESESDSDSNGAKDEET